MNNQPRSHGAETFATVSEAPPDSHLSRRKPSNRGFSAVELMRRDDSAPPTQPSIAPPSPLPQGRATSPLETAAAFDALEATRSPFSYRLLLALFGVALTIVALGSLFPGAGVLEGGPLRIAWIAAAGVLLGCLSMSALITFSFARRLEALARAAERVAPAVEPSAPAPNDAVASLARSLAAMTRRVELLQAELEQCVEEEQARVDELVRERTRELGRELADYRRALGPSSALLSVDLDGRVQGQPASTIGAWLGSLPQTRTLWDCFEQVSRGQGPRFEAAWRAAWDEEAAESPQLELLPRECDLGGRSLSLSYLPVNGPRGVERLVVLLRDVTQSKAESKNRV